jgi:O-antigen ligase
MKSEFRRVGRFVTSSIEVLLVAVLFVIASRYWAIEEHVAYLGLLGGVSLIAISHLKDVRFSVAAFLPLFFFLVFLLWIVVSSLWSPNFHLSLARAGTVAIVALTAVALGFSLSIPAVAKGLTLGVALLIVHASLHDALGPLGFLSLGSGPGLFTNISEMTYLLGAGVVAALALALIGRTHAAMFLLAAAFFLVTAAGISVLTMFFATGGALVVGLMILHIRNSSNQRRQLLGVFYPVLVVVGAILFWVLREPLLRPLGEAPDLSGRTIIWDWYFEAFLWEPLVGIGWGNTYNWPLTPGDTYPTGQYFIAHNGFLDLGLVTGAIGVALIVATLALVFLRGASHAMNPANPALYVFVPALIAYVVINDIMATSLPRYIGVFLVGVLVGLVTRESSKPVSHSSSSVPVAGAASG